MRIEAYFQPRYLWCGVTWGLTYALVTEDGREYEATHLLELREVAREVGLSGEIHRHLAIYICVLPMFPLRMEFCLGAIHD